MSATDMTCPQCDAAQFATAGTPVAKNGSMNGSARRRIGGTSWSPEATAAHTQPAVPTAPSPNGKRFGRRLGTSTAKSSATGANRLAPSRSDLVGAQPHPAPADPVAPAIEHPKANLGPTQSVAPRGQAQAPAAAPGPARRRKKRRSSGAARRSVTSPTSVAPAVSTARAASAMSTATATQETRSRKRRRHRRPWYRRPLLVAPLLLVGLVVAALGVVTYRAESTINAIRQVSTPPPVVADATLDDDPIWDSVLFDTGPARQAVRAIAASEGEEAPDTDDGGGFGRVRDAASNVGDLANGAAVAAGVKNVTDRSRTILVMGVDAQPGAPIDIAVRPDAMMVLRLDEEARTCRLLAIPRDTRTRLPGYGQTKINHALMVGGIPYQQLVVEQLLDLEIDHYVLVDFVGFEKLVDAIGGITIDVPEELDDRGVHFDAGRQTFDGERALAYVRYRADEQGDVGRIHRQWAVLEALLETGSTRDLVAEVNRITPALEDHLRSDLETTDFAAIAETYGGRCTVESIDTVLLDGLRVRLDDPMLQQSVYYNVVTEEQVREAVDSLLGKAPAAAGNGAISAGPSGQIPTSSPLAMTHQGQAVYAHRGKRYRKVSL
ncbi:MAG: LCP family protein [Thermomicrobiales bacterium]